MAYPYVQAANDYGPMKVAPLGFVIHMAEGGGTVGFLSRQNARGVSVHYVVEYSGQVVQMLRENRCSGSINPRDIRTTDDPGGFYGVTAAVAVMDGFARDPNAACLSVEIEGFARDGPNEKQAIALAALVNDIRGRHPLIGLLGHRDFQDYKPCPGTHIDWPSLGGHGPAGGEEVQTTVSQVVYPARKFTSKKGVKELRRFSATAEIGPIAAPYTGTVDADVSIEQSDGRVPHGSGFLRLASGGSAGLFIQSTAVDVVAPPPQPNCDAAVNLALDHVEGAVAGVTTAIKEARPR